MNFIYYLRFWDLLFAMKNITISFLCVFFASFWSVNVSAQRVDYREHRMEQFDISNGISSNNILNIEQDQYGFIWVATAEGLNRFDGRNFVPFTKGKTNISLSNNYAQYLKSATDGNVWIATSYGLDIYDYKGDSIRVILDNSFDNSISSNDIICFAETKEGMWIATYDKGINFYDYKSRAFSKLDLPDIFRTIYITYIHADRNDNLWIGTLSNGLYCYSLKNKSLSYFQTPRVQEIIQDSYGTVWIAADSLYYFDHHTQTLKTLTLEGLTMPLHVTRIEEDDVGLMWLGGIVGLGYFNLRDYYFYKKAVFTEVKQKGKNFDASFRAVNCIKMDRDNNIWVGTFGDGVYMINGSKYKFVHLERNILDNSSLSSNKIGGGMTYDEKERFFYIATDGAGIDVLNSDMKRIDNYALGKANSKGLNSNNLFSILHTTNGDLWCSSFGINVLRKGSRTFESYYHDAKKPGESILSNTVNAFAETRDKSIWICTDMGVTRYKDGKFSNEFYKLMNRRIDVRAIAVVDDYIWLGTYGDGIISYHIPTEKIDFYFNHEDLTQNYIRTIKRSGDTLCVATQGAGIRLFSLKEKQFFKSLNEESGLKSNYIQAIEFDSYGRIWVASNQGISYIAKNKIRHFDSKDGIQKNEFFNSFKTVSDNGSETIFFCGNDGINYFNPNDLPQYKRTSKVLFSSLKIYNQVVRPDRQTRQKNPLSENIIMTKKIELNNNQSFFSIGFINIDYNYTQHMRYSYMLKGFDTEWNDIGQQQEVSFRNLPAGKYVLLVKASNFDDDWNDNVSEMEIVIHPPFWRTPFAYFIYFVLFCLLLYVILKLSTIKMQAQHKINLEKSERQKDEEVHQAKLRFFTNISHELRTPLTLIIGPLESMKQKYPALAGEISVISQNAQKLLSLVNQLLDFRKSEMKEMKLKVKYAYLTDQIHKIIASFDGLRIEKRMNLSMVSSPLELYGWYDTDFVEKIMFNLLSNAYKFTPEEGNIVVELLGIEKEGVGWAQIKVTDSGIGIDNKETDLIFKRFYQSEKSSTSKKGSGIGLNLVKNLVDLHHGNISVSSVLNKGACFTVEIPIDKDYYNANEIAIALPSSTNAEQPEVSTDDLPTETEVVGKSAELQKTNKEKINILVVDDEIGICEYIKQVLPQEYHVIFASNGKEALSILSQQDFDIVISDVMMPEMDGITLCDSIKKNIETSHIPVIMLTAKSSIESKLEGLKTGADSYISKPFHPEHLQIRVEKLIESRKMFKNKFGKTFSFEMEHNENPSFDDLLLEKILKYINKNISKPELNGDKIAKDLSISRMTLHRKLKLLTGQTTSELIRGIRLKEAAYQIENTTKNISDICYEVGFNSPSYFTACFAEQYGMTPTEYLKTKRNKTITPETEQ